MLLIKVGNTRGRAESSAFGFGQVEFAYQKVIHS